MDKNNKMDSFRISVFNWFLKFVILFLLQLRIIFKIMNVFNEDRELIFPLYKAFLLAVESKTNFGFLV